MKLSSCYLEHLHSVGLEHANRLKSWVGGYKLYVLYSVRWCDCSEM
jgi:hypothetical protein